MSDARIVWDQDAMIGRMLCPDQLRVDEELDGFAAVLRRAFEPLLVLL